MAVRPAPEWRAVAAVSAEILMLAKENNLLIKEVPITVRYDVENTSTHNPIVHGMSVLTKVFTFISVHHPLSFYTLPGLIFLLIGIYYINGEPESDNEFGEVFTCVWCLSVHLGVLIAISYFFFSSI